MFSRQWIFNNQALSMTMSFIFQRTQCVLRRGTAFRGRLGADLGVGGYKFLKGNCMSLTPKALELARLGGTFRCNLDYYPPIKLNRRCTPEPCKLIQYLNFITTTLIMSTPLSYR